MLLGRAILRESRRTHATQDDREAADPAASNTQHGRVGGLASAFARFPAKRFGYPPVSLSTGKGAMDRIRRHLSYANVAATLALVFAISGGAIAASGGFTSGGALHACVNGEGTLKLLKAGRQCKNGQKTVVWNQTGPAGPRGATGATGASGTSGAPGAPGAPGTPAVSAWARVSAKGSLQAGSGVVSVTGTDPYEVQFDRNVRSCGAAGSVNNGTFGVVFASLTTSTDINTAFVAVTDEEGLSPNEFTVMLTC